jgi:hypothetical protein
VSRLKPPLEPSPCPRAETDRRRHRPAIRTRRQRLRWTGGRGAQAPVVTQTMLEDQAVASAERRNVGSPSGAADLPSCGTPFSLTSGAVVVQGRSVRPSTQRTALQPRDAIPAPQPHVEKAAA